MNTDQQIKLWGLFRIVLLVVIIIGLVIRIWIGGNT